MTPLWVSLEGVNGVGKTAVASALAGRLAGRATVLCELTDARSDPVIGDVVAALSGGRSFLRTGHPLTETMALLALKVREHERVAALTDPPELVIEDRGVDTVAVYQAAIGTPDSGSGAADEPADEALRLAAERVYRAAAPWRPLPDLTVLLLDDLSACERRLADREGRPVTPDERRIIVRADRLYRWLADEEPARIRSVDRTGRRLDDVVDDVAHLVETAADALLAGRGAR